MHADAIIIRKVAIFYEQALAAILAVNIIHAMKREQSRILAISTILAVKAMLHGAIFLATCNEILLLKDVS
jgi:hypothetical protein